MISLKKILLGCLFLFTFTHVIAQDTVIVQTLTFDSISTRRGVWQFPDDNWAYRKVLMSYTLKCDPATLQDGYNCGEWDYFTNTNIYVPTGELDSTALTHPYFKANNEEISSLTYTTSAVYDYIEVTQQTIGYNTTTAENTYSIGSGSNSLSYPFGTQNKQVRAQFVYTSSELQAAGVTAGQIDKLSVDKILNHQNERHICNRPNEV